MSKNTRHTKEPLLILASGSGARQMMLRNAGVDFTVHTADIDENSYKNQSTDYRDLAETLAQEKALDVSRHIQGALVIGGDQVLSCEGKMLSKADTPEAAKEKLKFLRGKKHTLCSSVSVIRNEEILWSHTEDAHLHMKDFDDAFLEAYTSRSGDVLTSCVGAYALEKHGAWLFDKIEGDYFTILGMPLLPLLAFLSTIGIGL